MTPGLSSANLIDHGRRVSFLLRLFPIASFLPFLLVVVVQSSCTNSDIKEPVEYKGPLREVENVETYYSEKNIVKVKLVAALLYEFANGDREFPKGIYVEFFDETGKLESTLRANHAFYFKTENQWRGRGKVEVRNVAKNEQLNTEELFWKPSEERIYTDQFVTIRQEDDVLYGQGLQARQDMSDYTILKPEGEFAVKEE
jgi:LPS export ABC transporter protein LptC